MVEPLRLKHGPEHTRTKRLQGAWRATHCYLLTSCLPKFQEAMGINLLEELLLPTWRTPKSLLRKSLMRPSGR